MPDRLERILGPVATKDPSQAMPASPGGLLGYQCDRGAGLRDLAVIGDGQDAMTALHDRITGALIDATARQARQVEITRLRKLLSAQVKVLRRLG